MSSFIIEEIEKHEKEMDDFISKKTSYFKHHFIDEQRLVDRFLDLVLTIKYGGLDDGYELKYAELLLKLFLTKVRMYQLELANVSLQKENKSGLFANRPRKIKSFDALLAEFEDDDED